MKKAAVMIASGFIIIGVSIETGISRHLQQLITHPAMTRSPNQVKTSFFPSVKFRVGADHG
jgi:hypothetical protein